MTLLAMWMLALLGSWIKRHSRELKDEDREDSMLVLSATLTLLGLIMGFTFAMATTRYDQRKLYEEEEANAIGTEYLRADLLPAAEAHEIKSLLRQYLQHRIAYYDVDRGTSLPTLDEATARLQDRMWSEITPVAAGQPNPVTALAVSGMNDVLNSQGYAQFAWLNRIPQAAWILMVMIALFANALLGYTKKTSSSGRGLLAVLPVIVAISFFLMADIDSPRGGVIHIQAMNLKSLAKTLRP